MRATSNVFALGKLPHVYNYFCNWQCLTSFQKCYSSVGTCFRKSTKLKVTLQRKLNFISSAKYLNFYHSMHVLLKSVIRGQKQHTY
jgi:hypothetical protein